MGSYDLECYPASQIQTLSWMETISCWWWGKAIAEIKHNQRYLPVQPLRQHADFMPLGVEIEEV